MHLLTEVNPKLYMVHRMYNYIHHFDIAIFNFINTLVLDNCQVYKNIRAVLPRAWTLGSISQTPV